MKKVLKKEVIIAFIIGILIASSITVYATGYVSKDINYTKKDGTKISVEDALNELYVSSDEKKYIEKGVTQVENGTITLNNIGFIPKTIICYSNISNSKRFVLMKNEFETAVYTYVSGEPSRYDWNDATSVNGTTYTFTEFTSRYNGMNVYWIAYQ